MFLYKVSLIKRFLAPEVNEISQLLFYSLPLYQSWAEGKGVEGASGGGPIYSFLLSLHYLPASPAHHKLLYQVIVFHNGHFFFSRLATCVLSFQDSIATWVHNITLHCPPLRIVYRVTRIELWCDVGHATIVVNTAVFLVYIYNAGNRLFLLPEAHIHSPLSLAVSITWSTYTFTTVSASLICVHRLAYGTEHFRDQPAARNIHHKVRPY